MPLQEVRGSFDAIGSVSSSDKGYWRALDEHLELTKTLKHVRAVHHGLLMDCPGLGVPRCRGTRASARQGQGV